MEQEIIDKKKRACLATSKWVKKNPEKARVAQKKYREKNRDKVRAACRDWHYRNMAKKKEAISDFISQHGVEPTRDDLIRMSRSFYWKKYAPYNAANQKRRYITIKGRADWLFQVTKKRSKRRGHPPPTITSDDVLEMMKTGVCSVTGLKLHFGSHDLKSGAQHPLAPSLDRIDSEKPYTKENTRLVCWGLNAGLGHWGLETYLEIARAAVRNAG